MFANAESYEQFMGRWSRLIAARLIEVMNVSDEGQLLDIGSGTGALSFVIAERKPKTRVVGIDASREYVAYANGLNPVPDRITFEIGDAQHLRFANATFASTLSLLAFNFIPDPIKALEEARRVTIPGGLVTAAVWDYGGDMGMLWIFLEASAALNVAAHKHEEAHSPVCASR